MKRFPSWYISGESRNSGVEVPQTLRLIFWRSGTAPNAPRNGAMFRFRRWHIIHMYGEGSALTHRSKLSAPNLVCMSKWFGSPALTFYLFHLKNFLLKSKNRRKSDHTWTKFSPLSRKTLMAWIVMDMFIDRKYSLRWYRSLKETFSSIFRRWTKIVY